MPTPPPLSVTQVAELADMPKRTVQYAISRGQLRAHKLPGATGAYLIDRADLDAWLAVRALKARDPRHGVVNLSAIAAAHGAADTAARAGIPPLGAGCTSSPGARTVASQRSAGTGSQM